MGDKISISNIQNSLVTVKSTLTNVQHSVGRISTEDEAARQRLQELIEELSQALQKIPESKKEQAEAVAASAEDFVEKAKTDKPNKTLLEISGEGLKKAAENLADFAPTVLSIASQVIMTVMQMKGLA